MKPYREKQYIYVSVRFLNDPKDYIFITEDPKTEVNDVVMIRLRRDMEVPAIVTDVCSCTEKQAPTPPDRTPSVTGPAGEKEKELFKDLHVPVKTSTIRIKGADGNVSEVTIKQPEKRVIKLKGNIEPTIFY